MSKCRARAQVSSAALRFDTQDAHRQVDTGSRWLPKEMVPPPAFWAHLSGGVGTTRAVTECVSALYRMFGLIQQLSIYRGIYSKLYSKSEVGPRGARQHVTHVHAYMHMHMCMHMSEGHRHLPRQA